MFRKGKICPCQMQVPWFDPIYASINRTHFSLKQSNPSTLIVNKTMVANFANSKRSSQFSMRQDPCDFLDSAQSYMYLSSDSAQLHLSRTALSLTKVFRSVHGSGQHGVRQCCPTRVLPATQQSFVSMQIVLYYLLCLRKLRKFLRRWNHLAKKRSNEIN